MAEVRQSPPSTIPLTGYADRFSVSAGGTIAFKVSSSSAAPYEAGLVRVVSCDPNPEGPGVIEHPMPATFEGAYPSRVQTAQLGSYLRIPVATHLDDLGSFTITALIWPSLLSGGSQCVLGRWSPDCGDGFALGVGEAGVYGSSGGYRLETGKPLLERRWYRVWASFDAASGKFEVGQAPLTDAFDADVSACKQGVAQGSPGSGDLLVAAMTAPNGASAIGHFNGKIEDPAMFRAALGQEQVLMLDAPTGPRCDPGQGTRPWDPECIARWDFSQGIDGRRVLDTGPLALHGELVNLPARGVTGSKWDGTVHAWPSLPSHYAAIHFHDDDLYDCEWDTDFSFDVPAGFRSGVYAVRLKNVEGDSEMIPFFVTAAPGQAGARLAVLIPTLTYTVYANIARGNTNASLRETVQKWGATPWNADDHQEFGLSTYNLHHDGSGIAYSSRRRPIITMRSATVCYPDVPGSGLRHFAADGHLWYWLETMGYDFDVITDDDLHERGLEALAAYDVVTTTTHPEYHTRESLDALSDYVDAGGRFMYLGGNGFYWKVAVSDAWPDAVEIRRAEGGIRAWAAEPGEYYNAFDGTLGGLWRRNGRPPQMLAGVGFTSQGGHRGDGYNRTPASFEPEHAWMFEGISEDTIGDFGLSGGGAAGFELDRADEKLGTPRNAVVVATSAGSHGDHFVLVPEDILTNLTSWNGEPFEDLIRSDIVYFDTHSGGAVFSVGSITFCGSLPTNDCQNNVSRLTRNVLDEFLSRGPAATRPEG